MARNVDGLSLGLIGAGSLLAYAGIKGVSIPGALQAVIGGKSPATAPPANPISGTTAPASAAGSTAAGDTGAHGASAKANQATGRLLAAGHGWATGQEWADLVSLWNQESGWDNLAMNPSSHAFGIAQALGHGTSSSAGRYGNQYPSIAANDGSAAAQIAWGLSYIKSTYGSPSAAWAHEQSAGWY
jgi:hypothetical protein